MVGKEFSRPRLDQDQKKMFMLFSYTTTEVRNFLFGSILTRRIDNRAYMIRIGQDPDRWCQKWSGTIMNDQERLFIPIIPDYKVSTQGRTTMNTNLVL